MGRSISRRPITGMILGATLDHGDQRNHGYSATSGSLVGSANNTGTTVDLDGNVDWLDYGDSIYFSHTDGSGTDKPFSFGGWYYFDTFVTSDGWTQLLSKAKASAGTSEYDVIAKASDIRFYLWIPSRTARNSVKLSSSPSLSTATWYHLFFTYDGSESYTGMGIYIDAVSQSLTDDSTGAYTGMVNQSETLKFGYTEDASRSRDMNGQVDGLRMYDRELTANEVATIYQEGRR